MEFTFGMWFAIVVIAFVVCITYVASKISAWKDEVDIAVQRIGWRVEDYKELSQRISNLEDRIDAMLTPVEPIE